MKTIKEIRNEANQLYFKSSHYIAGTFMAVTSLMMIVKSVLDVIGVEVGMDYLFVCAALFSPIEYGMVKASLLAYEHHAREVSTAKYTFLGLKNYFKVMLPFVGRTVVVYTIQALVLAAFVYGATHSFDDLALCLSTVLTGNISNIYQDGVIQLVLGTLMGVVTSIIVGFVADAYFALSYYYVVEEKMGLWDSLVASAKSMSGHFWSYILLRLSYLPLVILAGVIVNVFSMALTTMFQQLLTILPAVPVLIFNLLLVISIGLISSLVSIMLYKGKETMAITVFYKEVKE